jgi:hypothetical protein
MEYMFGSGLMWGTPTQDANGNAIANPTPVLFGTMQDVSVDLSFDLKQLYGQKQFPVALGRGKGKIDGKAHVASVNGAMLNSLFFGQTVTAGTALSDQYDTTGTTAAASVTPTVPSSGTWVADLGVRDAAGNQLTRVASAPAVGQYSVAAGVYTFNAGQNAATPTLFFDFKYSFTLTTAKKQDVSNLVMGYAPAFQTDLLMPYGGKNLVLTLYWCIGSKLSFATKLDDFVIPEFDFQGAANPNTGQVMTWGVAE